VVARCSLIGVVLVVVLAACGSDDDGASKGRGAAFDGGAPGRPAMPNVTTDEDPATPPAKRKSAPSEKLPLGVPSRATGRADAAATAVVRRWSAALRAGEVARAASYFAQPSRVQNGTPVVTLRSRADRLAFNVSLPCGAVPTKYGAAKGFTIVTFRLTERVGGDCAGSAGQRARCAIRVRDGHITEWYRLADVSPRATPTRPSVPSHNLSI